MKTNGMDLELLARDKSLFLPLNKADNSGENQGLDLSFALNFLNGACLLMIKRKVFMKKIQCHFNIWNFGCIVDVYGKRSF